MSEKKQIVDNPLLLTSLFSEGVFYIPSNQKPLSIPTPKIENQEVETLEVKADSVVEIENKVIENPPKEEIKKIILPEATVINLIYDKNPSHWPEYLNEPLTKIMGAIKIDGKPIAISDYAVYNLTLMPEVKDISKFIAELNTKRIMIWSSQLKIEGWEGLNKEYQLADKKVLWLKDIGAVMSTQTDKIEAWTSMKKFFNMI
jgi:hypothetical protein